jgi:hypothetical protein
MSTILEGSILKHDAFFWQNISTDGGVRKEAMNLDLQEQRQQAHALLDLLSPAKLGAVRSLLEVMIDDGEDEELTEEDRAAIQAGLDSLDKHEPVPMEDVLADLGLTMADFEALPASDSKRNG